MKKINIVGVLVETCNWVLHPIANYKELKEYREDYEKEVLGFRKERERLEKKCKDKDKTYQEEVKDLEDKIAFLEEQKKTIYTFKNKQEEEFKEQLQKKQKTINKLRGQFGGTKKEKNCLIKENETLKSQLDIARKSLIESNKKILEQNNKINVLSKKTPREKIDYTLMKRSKKNEN